METVVRKDGWKEKENTGKWRENFIIGNKKERQIRGKNEEISKIKHGKGGYNVDRKDKWKRREKDNKNGGRRWVRNQRIERNKKFKKPRK